VSPPGPDPILTVRNVRHAYGERTVLRGVDLTVRRGEIYALLGPNGAGKTTLIRAACGRLKPDEGEVRLAGRDPFADPAARALLGLVPQTIALYGHLTVAENLEVFGRLSGVKGASLRDASAHAMAVTEVAERAHSQVRQLSGGLQRRVNIAAAILHHPSLLVLDEPTVGVDPPAQQAIAQVLRALRSEGVAIVMITHDLDQAGELADRAGFLREGLMALEGEPQRLVVQAFDDQLEVRVELEREPDACGARRLAAEGLSRDRDSRVWTCFAKDGYALAAQLDRRLREAGLGAREVRVRRPSLENLFALVNKSKPVA